MISWLNSFMELKDRIQEILNAGYTRKELAIAARVTPASVTHWLNGSSKNVKGPSAAGLQALTGFSASWISSGKGSKQSGDGPQSGLPDCLRNVGAWIAAADDLTRDQIKPLFERLCREPDRMDEIIRRVIAISNGSPTIKGLGAKSEIDRHPKAREATGTHGT